MQFEFDVARAASSLDRMKKAPPGTITMPGDAWAQGAMGALLNAEFLAAQAGLVPWFELPDGSRGVLTIGAARECIDDAPENVRTLYLATHALVRSTHASAARPSGDAPALDGTEEEIGAFPVIVALTVVAVAAIIGAAWYFTSRSEIEVEGRNVRTTALAAEASRLGLAQLEQTGRIDPGVWEVFKTIAEREGKSPWVPVAIAGIAVAGGVGGFVAWRRWKAGAVT